MKKIIIFDVCETLFYSNTTIDYLNYYFKENRKFVLVEKFFTTIFGRVLNKFFYKVYKVDLKRKILTKFLLGEKLDDIETSVENFYNDFLNTKKIKESHLLLKKYKEKNYQVILSSASYDFIVKKIAEKLSIETYISSKLEMKDGIFTGKIEYDNLRNKKKKFLEMNLKYDELLVASDNKTDLPLFKIADKCYILTKSNNIEYWKSQDIKNKEIIEV